MAMKVGVVLPQNETSDDPAQMRRWVMAMEAAGMAHVAAYDHVLGANPDRPGGWSGPYTHQHSFHEVLTLFAWMSGITDSMELVTEVLVLPQRQTALVAKQAAEIDLLSGGRLRLGVGLGWNAVEYEALGQDFAVRGRRIAEQVKLMRLLWRDELVNFRGDFDRVSDAGLNPLPRQRSIPIWMGGVAEAALRRSARLADGHMVNRPMDSDVPATVALMRRLVEEAGRDPSMFGIDVRVSLFKGMDVARQRLERCREAGVSHLSVVTDGCGFAWPDAHAEAVAEFAALLD
ncbi:MAG: LLM class F420-dependent oxidoreductase [Candidatus Dormibacteria bacterium]